MAITTYAELKTSVTDFLNRDDSDTIAPTFISLAETDMSRRVRHWRGEKRSSAEIDTQYSAIPADFLEVIRFHITSGDTRPLELISQAELLDRKFRNLNTVPDGTYTSELYYNARLPALSDSTTTNWLLEYHPDAYLYGSLVHSAPYLKEDARLQTWAALYQNAVDAINTESESSKFGGSGRRMKIRSY